VKLKLMRLRFWMRCGAAAGLATACLALTAAAAASPDLRLAEAVRRRDAKAVSSLLAQHADVGSEAPWKPRQSRVPRATEAAKSSVNVART
jgi:hypothetical protein